MIVQKNRRRISEIQMNLEYVIAEGIALVFQVVRRRKRSKFVGKLGCLVI